MKKNVSIPYFDNYDEIALDNGGFTEKVFSP